MLVIQGRSFTETANPKTPYLQVTSSDRTAKVELTTGLRPSAGLNTTTPLMSIVSGTSTFRNYVTISSTTGYSGVSSRRSTSAYGASSSSAATTARVVAAAVSESTSAWLSNIATYVNRTVKTTGDRSIILTYSSTINHIDTVSSSPSNNSFGYAERNYMSACKDGEIDPFYSLYTFSHASISEQGIWANGSFCINPGIALSKVADVYSYSKTTCGVATGTIIGSKVVTQTRYKNSTFYTININVSTSFVSGSTSNYWAYFSERNNLRLFSSNIGSLSYDLGTFRWGIGLNYVGLSATSLYSNFFTKTFGITSRPREGHAFTSFFHSEGKEDVTHINIVQDTMSNHQRGAFFNSISYQNGWRTTLYIISGHPYLNGRYSTSKTALGQGFSLALYDGSNNVLFYTRTTNTTINSRTSTTSLRTQSLYARQNVTSSYSNPNASTTIWSYLRSRNETFLSINNTDTFSTASSTQTGTTHSSYLTSQANSNFTTAASTPYTTTIAYTRQSNYNTTSVSTPGLSSITNLTRETRV